MLTLSASSPAFSENIIIDKNKFTHITFQRITPNKIHYNNETITIHVNKSSSFLLLPFNHSRKIETVSFQWKSRGKINNKDAKYEETKKGDDAYLRIGLILKGKRTLENPIAPKWVKQVRKKLRLPSDRVIYLVPKSQHKDGQRWISPYSEKVEMIAINSKAMEGGWNLSEYILNNSQIIVGLWIMADGDNTQSVFTTQLRALTIN